MVGKILRLVCILSVWLAPRTGLAENRALIVTIGEAYRDAGIPAIRGPEQDNVLAKDLAHRLGFGDRQIMVLAERQATLTAVRQGLEWLKSGLQSSDKALFYFSGHGSQVKDLNGDENDDCDESLLLGTGEQLIDDELGVALHEISEHAQVIVFIDACFSGTIARNMESTRLQEGLVKYWVKGDQVCNVPVNTRSLARSVVELSENEDLKNVVVTTAAGENEWALGSLNKGQGSVFTQSVMDIVAAKGTEVSYRQLRDDVAECIRQQCNHQPCERISHQTPQLDGDDTLFGKNLLLQENRLPENGEVQKSESYESLFDEMVKKSQFPVTIDDNQKTVRLGEPISFTVETSKQGYLTLVEVDATGKAQVLFPNKFSQNNYIDAGKSIRIPADIGMFRMVGQPAGGKSKIYALLTLSPIQLQLKVNEQGKFAELLASNYERNKVTVHCSLPALKKEGRSLETFGATSILIYVAP